jgi:deoxyribose-phosphate aldolase
MDTTNTSKKWSKEEILARLDYTVLKAAASRAEIEKLCREAETFKTASVCIPPCYVKYAREAFPALPVCTVVGFPLGYNEARVKIAETDAALSAGASEIDMVINLAALKSGEFGAVEDEIRRIKYVTGEKILKVIVETCYLTEDEKIRLCNIVSESGADYIKTSTGFGSAGANLDDIALFKRHIGKNVKIKAAGGIKTLEAMVSFLEAGCSRLGCSSFAAFLS